MQHTRKNWDSRSSNIIRQYKRDVSRKAIQPMLKQ